MTLDKDNEIRYYIYVSHNISRKRTYSLEFHFLFCLKIEHWKLQFNVDNFSYIFRIMHYLIFLDIFLKPKNTYEVLNNHVKILLYTIVILEINKTNFTTYFLCTLYILIIIKLQYLYFSNVILVYTFPCATIQFLKISVKLVHKHHNYSEYIHLFMLLYLNN